jgi:hypothetical protein
MKTVCVNGELIRLLDNDPVPNPICIDCGIDTEQIEEHYMVHDNLWCTGNPAERGMLCIGCFEKRLGRRLCREDFRPYMISNVEDHDMPRFR